MNLATNLERSAFYFPNHVAVIEEDKEISFQEFDQESNRIATALINLGTKPGDHIALCAPNSYEWLAFYFGVLKAGAVAVTLSNALSKMELSHSLDDARPRILFTTDDKLSGLDSRKNLGYLEKVISPNGDIPFNRLKENGVSSFRAVDLDRNNIAAILYTGGTTGTPKGVMLTHENIKASVHNVCHFERSSEKDRAICFLPLNHVFAQVHIMNSMVHVGGSVVIQSSFDLDRVVDAIRRNQVTKFYGVPTIYVRLLQLEALTEKFNSVTYCFSAAASMAAEIVHEWKSRLQLNIHEAYGMTETASMVTYNHYIRHVVGSVGTTVNIAEVQIRDPQGSILKKEEEGEICICGPNVMRGYLNNPEETKAVFWGNWLRSGDIGVFDKNDYLYIIDRLKDMIITGGENVYPREIEEVLYKRPEVGECSVIGVPDKEYGEKVTACIVLKSREQQLDAANLKSFLKSHLASFKVPKEFIVLDELPRSAAGKILKRKLKQNVIEKFKKR
jgi:long-chain acyl-CoA synthetase